MLPTDRYLYYILDDHHCLHHTTDLRAWSRWMDAPTSPRIVAQEHLLSGLWISTVFLGINHRFSNEGPQILFETMVFDHSPDREGSSANDLDCRRYTDWPAALAGHSAVVARWAKGA